MCLIVLACDPNPDLRLALAANRDEYHDRPTAPASWWSDVEGVLGGRDLRQGGTWLGITRSGRFAAVTNYREPGAERPDAATRGLLVADFLRSSVAPRDDLAAALARGGEYNGFNLLAGDASGVFWTSNRAGRVEQLSAGVHGLSNHLLDTPWPKVTRTTSRLRELLAATAVPTAEQLLGLLDDRRLADDADLPSTGVPLELERRLSAPVIISDRYGTRSSTAIVVRADGLVTLVEWTRDPRGNVTAEERFELRLAPD